MSRALAIILGICVVLNAWPGCALHHESESRSQAHAHRPSAIATIPDTRDAIALDEKGAQEHRAVMLQHLESLQQIVEVISRKDFERAAGLTELHLGFFKHREAMQRQQPGDFPPGYHDLAMVHHEAAEELAQALPSGNYDRIMPKLNGVLRACVACHLSYRVTVATPPVP